jgi:hypothetical protein
MSALGYSFVLATIVLTWAITITIISESWGHGSSHKHHHEGGCRENQKHASHYFTSFPLLARIVAKRYTPVKVDFGQYLPVWTIFVCIYTTEFTMSPDRC